jgi:hypothetical protein
MKRAGKIGNVAIGIAASAFVAFSAGGVSVAALVSAEGIATAQAATTPTTAPTAPTTTAPTAQTPTTPTTAPTAPTTKPPKTKPPKTKPPKKTPKAKPPKTTTKPPKTTTKPPKTTTTTIPTVNTKQNWVSVAQTVLASTTTTGKISGKPVVFTQLVANGSEPATVKVPMSESGLRNLLGLAKPPIVDGKAVWNLDLNGSTTERTISHFSSTSLPLKVSARYWLNGKAMSASDIVGKSGTLRVKYTVQNVTSEATKVTFKSVFGNETSLTPHVPIPIAAVVAVTFPSSFTNLNTPGGSSYGYGNGTTSTSWTLFTFKPLGDLTQSVSYAAQVTNASVPSATVEAEVIPPQDLNTLPTISEPGASTIPTVTVGVHLASLQSQIQAQLKKISAAASKLLAEFQAVAVPAAVQVSNGAATTSTDLAKIATDATQLSTSAGTVSGDLSQRATEAANFAAGVATAQQNLTNLPVAFCAALSNERLNAACVSTLQALPLYQAVQSGLSTLATVAADLSTGFTKATTDTQTLQNTLATTVTNDLTTASSDASSFSQQALALSNTLAEATVAPSKQGKTIQPKQISGGAQLDAAVAQLDAAITQAGTSVDAHYATLDALDTRAFENQLVTGDAEGATTQVGVVIMSVSGADQTTRDIHNGIIIGVTALTVGATIGLGLYRIRKGWASSLAPTKK